MFGALIPAAEAVVPAVASETILAQFPLALEALEDFTLLDITFHAMQEKLETIEQLSAFKSAIEQFGCTRSLIAFANYNGSLTKALPLVPGLEALDEAPMVLSDEALTQISAAAEGVMGDAWAALKHFGQRYKTFFKWVGAIKTGLSLIVPVTITILTGGLTWPYLAASVVSQAVDWTIFGVTQNYFKSLTAAVGVAVNHKLPETEEEYHKYKAELAEIFKERGGVTFRDGEGHGGKTLEEKGYTNEKVIEFIRTTEADAHRLADDEHVYTAKLEALGRTAKTDWGQKGFALLNHHISLTLEEAKKIVSRQASAVHQLHSAAEAAKHHPKPAE